MKNKALIGVAKYLGLFILIFFLVYGFINGPAILAKIDFWLGERFASQAANEIQINDQGQIPKVADRNSLANNNLYIPSLHLSAQITWNVAPADEQFYLRKSVIHLQKTALPGQKGNVFLTGHSSYYWWLGKYTNIFANLNHIKNGDKIAIVYQNRIYTYKVKSVFVVRPYQVDVLSQGSGRELTLMTCVPIGTNINRLIVKADQIGVSNR